MNFDWNHPAVIGIIIAIPSFLLGYLGYRRSVQVDKITEQSGAASSQQGAIAQVISGLNSLIEVLQEDNKILREGISDLQSKLDKMTREQLDLIEQVAHLREELHKYGKRVSGKLDDMNLEEKAERLNGSKNVKEP